jgi:hypothetical protein
MRHLPRLVLFSLRPDIECWNNKSQVVLRPDATLGMK